MNYKIHSMEDTTICGLLKDGSFGEIANTERGFGNQKHNAQLIVAALNKTQLPFNPLAEVIFFTDVTSDNRDIWFAVRDDFISLAESHFGAHKSMDGAYEILLYKEAQAKAALSKALGEKT